MKTLNIKYPREETQPDTQVQVRNKLSKGDAKFGYLIITLLGDAILGILHADISLFILTLAIGLVAAFWEDLYGKLRSPSILMRFVVVGALTAFFILNFAGEANAAWLQNIESWMTTSFPDATEIATLIFNVLRAIVVIFLAVQGVLVFLAIKRQEGFFEAVQLPVIALLVISVVDIIAGFVIGT